MPVDIGPIHIGDPEQPAAPAVQPLTIGQVTANLPDGVTLYQVVTHDSTGKVVTDRAPSPAAALQPGDTIELRGNGKTWITHVNADATDIAEPTDISHITPPTRSKSGYPTADEISADPLGAAKKRYQAVLDDPQSTPQDVAAAHDALQKEQDAADKASGKNATVDANTQALAQAAVLKSKNGQNPTQAELEAYFKVKGASQPGAYAPPVPGYSGAINPHDSGNVNGAVDIPVGAGTTVDAITGGTVKVAGAYGTAGNAVLVQGDDGRQYMYQHVDPSIKVGTHISAAQPLGTVSASGVAGHWTGPHVHIAVAGQGDRFEEDHGTAVGAGPGNGASVSTPDFLKQVYAGTMGAPPANGLPDLNAPPGKNLQIHALGDKLYQFDPTTGAVSVKVDASGDKAPTTHAIGNVLYQWDPATHTWGQALVGPLSPTEQKAQQDVQGKVVTALQQADNTKKMIAQQLANGQITPAEAAQYWQAQQDYTQAALEGTTPWERYQFQMQQQTARAQTAKDLLDTQLQESGKMAQSLLSDSITGINGAKYGASALAPGTLSSLFLGGLDAAHQQAQPLSDLAQQLLQPIAAQAAAKGLDPRIGGPAVTPGTPAPTGPLSGNPFDAGAQGAQVQPGAELPPWMQTQAA